MLVFCAVTPMGLLVVTKTLEGHHHHENLKSQNINN
jgi:hypothetical protein